MQECIIETEFIKLDQLLKLASIAQTGGHAKMMIQEELVKLNGEVCTQRGRKIRDEDIIDVEGFGEIIVKSTYL